MGDEELRRLVHEDKLKDVKGIGEALNDKIRELVLTGNLPYYIELKASIPEGLLDMLKVPGLGPKKINTLYQVLGIKTLGELEYACKENRLVTLKGFGPRTQDNIVKGIEFLRRSQGLYFYSEALQIADEMQEYIKGFSALIAVSLAGSIRRCKEIVKDIDLVASTDDPGGLALFFTRFPRVEEVIAQGETKVSVRLQEGINADLRMVKAEEFPYALHHFTGSKEHNTAMRQRAKSSGMKINEYGLFQGEERIACESEADLFQALGLAYIPPELRENYGEIEAAEKGMLPTPVKQEDIQGIFHVHTLYSDGKNSLEEMVRFCLNAGYSYIGITEHSQSAFYARGLNEENLKKQMEEIQRLNEKYQDITIFKGIESDIRSDGTLDYADDLLDQLDFVIASVHSGLGMSWEKMTERLLRALSHPRVTMLGHPTGRLLLGREGYPFDIERVLEKAMENRVIIELNASPARLDLDWRHLKRAKELGLMVSINPDAHSIEEIKDVNLGVAIARKGWLEKKDVFNTRSRDDVKAFFQSRS